jgi:cysteine desulfurase
MCFARAVELCNPAQDIAALRDQFESEVLSALEDVQINGAREPRLPNTSNLLFRGISAQALLIALDMRRIAVSTGSACSSGSIEPSPVLLAMGRSREEAKSSIRFSFGRYNTADDVRVLTEAVIACARQLRKTSSREKQLVG